LKSMGPVTVPLRIALIIYVYITVRAWHFDLAP